MSELNAADAFMNAGATRSLPRNPKALTRIVGFESSGVVDYEGSGAYFLDKVRDGVWRLEVYPDEVLVRDPFEQPQPGQDRVAAAVPPLADGAAACRIWARNSFATPVNVPADRAAAGRRAVNGALPVEPGVWLLSSSERSIALRCRPH